jgi:hypothetical protein
VDAKLRAEARRSGRAFKQVVNDCLRFGLHARSKASVEKPFKVHPRPLGSKQFNYDNIEELLDEIEGPYRK